MGYTNVELPEDAEEGLFDEYLRSRGANPRTTEVYRYYGLYLTDPEGSVDHQYSYASRVKLLAAIDAFLSELPVDERVAFVGRYWLMLPLQDMARQLNCREGTLKSSLHRTRKKLRRHLEQEGLL